MELPIICSNCGAVLDGDINRNGALEVELCVDCEAGAYDKGYDQGLSDAE
ncbi:MAG: hypothetical protein H8D67_08785 [Deltaproteobacteria bacterium]|nr:hypothetical protein [Deltaproteobacteria bacterium]